MFERKKKFYFPVFFLTLLYLILLKQWLQCWPAFIGNKSIVKTRIQFIRCGIEPLIMVFLRTCG